MPNQPSMDPHAPETPAALPQLDELPVVRRNGLDPEAVGEAFKRFEDHIVSLQDELRSLDAAILEARAARASVAEHSPEGGSAARTESLNLIRAAAEFAELLERDGREEAQKRLRAAEDELHSQRLKLVEREAELDRERRSIEARRDEVLERALEDARATLERAEEKARETLREAEAAGARLLEVAREQTIEITSEARGEAERQLEWARAQGEALLRRAQTEAAEVRTLAGVSAP